MLFAMEKCWTDAAHALQWDITDNPYVADVLASKQCGLIHMPAGLPRADQAFNHVKNQRVLTHKALAAKTLQGHVRQADTYRLDDMEETLALLDRCTSEPDAMWVLKVAHMDNGRGVKMATSAETLQTLHDVASGHGDVGYDLVCGLIHPPLLVDGRKCDFRVYVLLASVEPLVVLVYRTFMTRVSAFAYDTSHPESLNTISRAENKTEPEWNRCQLSPARLDALTRPGFSGSVVLPQVVDMVRGIFLAAAPLLDKTPGRYALFGLDAMLDANEKLYFIELNASPQLSFGGASAWKHGLNFAVARDTLTSMAEFWDTGMVTNKEWISYKNTSTTF